MKNTGIKYQITIPKELSDRIEEDLKNTYLSKSSWFVKLAREYIDNKEKNKTKKKVLDLDIE